MGTPAAASDQPSRRGFWVAVERVLLGAGTTLVGVNLWTGFPLLALWVGSQFAGSTGLSSNAVFIVIGVLAATELIGVFVLGRLSIRYDRITGREAGPRQSAPWMRSMRAERKDVTTKRRQLNAVERIVIVMVVAAVIAFEIWFFFFAGSSLPRNA